MFAVPAVATPLVAETTPPFPPTLEPPNAPKPSLCDAGATLLLGVPPPPPPAAKNVTKFVIEEFCTPIPPAPPTPPCPPISVPAAPAPPAPPPPPPPSQSFPPPAFPPPAAPPSPERLY